MIGLGLGFGPGRCRHFDAHAGEDSSPIAAEFVRLRETALGLPDEDFGVIEHGQLAHESDCADIGGLDAMIVNDAHVDDQGVVLAAIGIKQAGIVERVLDMLRMHLVNDAAGGHCLAQGVHGLKHPHALEMKQKVIVIIAQSRTKDLHGPLILPEMTEDTGKEQDIFDIAAVAI